MQLFKLVLVLLLSLFSVSLALAQSPNGKISGLVLDSTSGVIPGADLIVVNDFNGVKTITKTNREGIYVFPNLPPGPYRLQVSKQGFKTLIKPDIVLNVQDALSINFTLPVGAVSDSVTVEGGATIVNTTDASVSTVVDRKFVENIPLNGRSFQTLIQLTPGVVLTPASYSSQGQFSVNGQRADANYFTVDGTSANAGSVAGIGLNQAAGGSLPALSALGGTNSLVSVDAMQEFRVQTSSFAPEFGRTPGAQISIVTRSGTNQFHGTLFNYFRNDVLDANDWFANHNGLAKPRERQNDFGGVLGGPIIKNKTFFFFSYEGLRLTQPQTQISIVPNAASRSAAPTAIQPFLNAFPVANGSDLGGGFAQFGATYSDPASLDAYSLRVDHTINSRLALFGRYNYSPSSVNQRAGSGSGVLSNTQTSSFTTHTLTLGLAANISQVISNELRMNYSNVVGATLQHIDNFGGAVPVPDSLFFPAGFSSANALGSFVLAGAGTASSFGLAILPLGANAVNEQRQMNLVDNLSIVVGSHQLKSGVDYRWLAPISDPPAYTISPAFLGISGAGGVLGGIPLSVVVRAFQDNTLLGRNFSLYGQDTWKIRSRLTVTYGLRWDVNPALTGKSNSSDPLTVQGLSNPTTMTLAPHGTTLYGTTYGNVAPRIGLAYQLREKLGWESVLRGGVGIFYDSSSGFLGTLAANFPFASSKTLTGVPFPLTPAQAAPLPISQSLPQTGTFVIADPNLKLPRTYQWNVAMEQSLGASQSLAITYLGAIGRDLLRQDTLLNPNPNFQTVFVTRNTATSDYHALQLKVQRKLTHGLQGLASYTWSHSIDLSSNDSNTATTPSSVSAPSIDRGNSDFDVRNSFTGALTYDLPFPQAPGTLHSVFGGWSIDSFLTARSALPVNLIGSLVTFNGTQFSTRPNVVPGIPLYLYGSQYPGGKIFNHTPNQGGPGCKGPFCPAAKGQQGNLGRNVLRGFPAWQDDFTIRRRVRISEQISLQFRAEFFNVFNHPNFANPMNSFASGQFGQSTQTLGASLGSGGTNGGFSPLYQIGGPRSVQLALKLQF
jgi:hypothetical protein